MIVGFLGCYFLKIFVGEVGRLSKVVIVLDRSVRVLCYDIYFEYLCYIFLLRFYFYNYKLV